MRAGLFLQALLCGLLAGCGLFRTQLDRELLHQKPTDPPPERFAELYSVRFPYVLDVTVADRPELSGHRPLRVDGRIDLGEEDRLCVEGKTAPQIAQLIAQHVGVDPGTVQVRVQTYNSQRLFLHGEVNGDTRAVSYIGPESVLEMLQRTGGITSGAEVGDIQVI